MSHWKALALLFAGTLASVIVRILIPDSISVIFSAFLILLFLILFIFGSGVGSLLLYHYRIWRRKGNRILPPKVGILNDMGWNVDDPEIRAWTDVSPEDWKAVITEQASKKNVKIKVELLTTVKDFTSYAAILNPYGGVYPERDIKDFETLNDIMRYVKDGGLFANVADMPGYWAYSAVLRRRLDTTPPVYAGLSGSTGEFAIVSTRPFDLTPFMQKLGLRVFNTENHDDLVKWKAEFEKRFSDSIEQATELYIGRVVLSERNVVPILMPRMTKDKQSVTPLFWVKYGEGMFLISLVFLVDQYPSNAFIKRVIADAIIDNIAKCNEKEPAHIS